MLLRKLTAFSMLLAASVLSGEEMVSNGQFEKWSDGKPSSWTIRSKQEYSQQAVDAAIYQGQALGVHVTNASSGYGEVIQKIAVEPNTRYNLSGKLKAELPKSAFYQIKLFKDGKETSRMNLSSNKNAEWTQIEKVFSSGSSDAVGVLLRWNQKAEYVGNHILFADVQMEVEPPLVYSGAEVEPVGVSTFNSVGLYWKPTGGTATRAVTTAYRKQGSSEWKEALPLWFDDNSHPAPYDRHTGEYRGSIVGLDAGSHYEVKLQLQDGPERIFTVQTWSEDFKIARTVTLPAVNGASYTITEGGSAEEGYVLYVPEGDAAWDANNAADYNLKIDASWVIVRGFTLKGGKNHGITLGGVQNVVIEDCDISGWGATRSNGQAYNLNSAIYSSAKALERIVIQNCELHHPRSDSNSWSEKRPGTNSSHPEGPQGITFKGGRGQFVIRNNRIYSDIDHMFNDAMGETSNFGYGGFPNRDSDIYDNFVSHCWDDGLEIEGADMNVRVFNNYIDFTYGAIGAAAPCLGPVYFYRNVYGVSRKHSSTDSNGYRGHYLVKLGNEKPQYTRGRMFIFHNTALQPPAFEPNSGPKSSGAQSGIVFTSSKKTQQNMTTRNNVIQTRSDGNWAILDQKYTINNDFDYDFYNGKIRAKEGSEANAIIGTPVYERAADGRLWLAPGTLGHDSAVRIPNFNDDFVGAGPDMGAVETHSKAPKPNTWPDFPENYDPTATSVAVQPTRN